MSRDEKQIDSLLIHRWAKHTNDSSYSLPCDYHDCPNQIVPGEMHYVELCPEGQTQSYCIECTAHFLAQAVNTYMKHREQDWYADILEFHKEFGHHIEPFPRTPPENVRALRSKLIREEVNELFDGLDDADLVKITDGAADSIVVILGTCISYGIDLRPIWDEVHKSNMAKKGGGKRADGKSLKPEGWKPPQIKELLDEQRIQEPPFDPHLGLRDLSIGEPRPGRQEGV